MKQITKLSLVTVLSLVGISSNVNAAESLSEAFSNAKVKGDIKSYYYAQTFDGASGKKDSSIWVNGGSLNFLTDNYKGLIFGGTFQVSDVTSKNDDSSVTKTTMDAEGSVLSEAYLQYTYKNTTFKGGRQFIKTPLLAGSGSRLIKESFEGYLLVNTDLANTTIIAGKVTKYQQRTDYTTTTPFTSANTSAHGAPGQFMKIANDGIDTLYIKNLSIPNLAIQFQYANADKIADLIYIDTKYSIGSGYLAAQYYNTNYDSSSSKDNSLYGLKAAMKISKADVFVGFTSSGGDAGDAAVVRGLGQGAYAHYTATTKTAGASAFNADTNSWQIGIAYSFDRLKTKLRYSTFDQSVSNSDLDEITLNLEYQLNKELKAQIDYSVLDYENNTKDATDLRTRLIYSF